MNPEELRKLMESAVAAIQRGGNPQEVNAAIQQATQLPDLSALTRAVHAAEAQAAPEPGGREQAMQRLAAGGGSAVGDFARMAAQGATFGFADELAGLAAGAGAMVPGGRSPGEAIRETTEASRQRVEDLRTTSPGASTASEIAGGLLPFGGASAAAARKGGSLTRGLLTGRATKPGLAEAGQTAARTFQEATKGTLRREGAKRGLLSGAGTAARGAGVGAAYGGLQGAGEAEGGLGERAAAAGEGAKIGGLVGGVLAPAARLPAQLRGFQEGRSARNVSRNPRVAMEAEEVIQRQTDLPTRPSEIVRRSEDRMGEIQKVYREIDESGRVFSSPQIRSVLGDFRNKPEVRRAFQRRGHDGYLSRAMNDKEFGLTLEEVQDVRGTLQDMINKAKGEGETNFMRDLSKMRRFFDDAVDEINDQVGVANRAWREAVVMPDAAKEGAKAAKKGTDYLQATLDEFSEQPRAQMAARTGAVYELLDSMRKGSGVLRPTADLQERLGILIPDETARNEIIGIMAREGRGAALHSAIDSAVKAATFFIGGSSVIGAGVLAF